MSLCCIVSLVASEFQYIVEWNENLQHLNSSSLSYGHLAHFLAMAFSVFFLPSSLFLIAACQFLALSNLAASVCSLSYHLFLDCPLNRPSSSRTSFNNVFLDSDAKHLHYMPSLLRTFNAHVTWYHISVFI